MVEGLFSPVYISQKVQEGLAKGFVVRPLEPTDYEKGFLEVLSDLTTVGKLTKGEFMGKTD